MGIDSLKIEGRMKSIHYVATVVSVYRKVIDAYCADPENFVMKSEWLVELEKCANREADTAFFEGEPSYEQQMYGVHDKKLGYDFVGLVLAYNEETQVVTLQQRNYFKPGDKVEFFGPEIENVQLTIGEITNEKGQVLDAARHPLEIIQFKCPVKLYPNNMMRKGLK